MKELPCITYMYENKYKTEMANLILKKYENKNQLRMNEFSDCYILPSKYIANGENPPWGRGGVFMNDCIVSESIIHGAFGGEYEFDKTNTQEITGKVIHIPILKDHWGHFLIDVLCRFWFVILPEYEDYTITCCANLKSGILTGSFFRVFELLGIVDRLKIITKPVHCSKLIIPDYSLGFDRPFSFKYLDMVNILIASIPNNKEYSGKKIYLTRTKFLKSRFYEIGEKQIENIYRRLGFEIFAPEKMSIEEQISCFQSADEIVSLSGTIPHNIVFSRNGLKFTILNRQPIINLPQLRINQMMKNVRVTYVDVWHPIMEKNPKPYGKGAVWVILSDKFLEFIYAHYNTRIKKTNHFVLVLQKIHWLMVSFFDCLRG